MDVVPSPPVRPISPKPKDIILFKRSSFFAALLPISHSAWPLDLPFGVCRSSSLSRRQPALPEECPGGRGFSQPDWISSTPIFFVNGLAVVGAQPYEVFKQIIEKELAGEIPQ